MGFLTHTGMAEPQSQSRQGLRANHRFRNRVALFRVSPADCQTNHKIVESSKVILNRTLRHGKEH